jgi:hypothetical protein
MPTTAVLPFTAAVFWMVAGIIISLVLPLAVKAIKGGGRLEENVKAPSLATKLATAWVQYGGNRYLVVLAAAVVVAGVLVFVLDLKFYTPRDAALAGFGWESLVNKLFGSNEAPPPKAPAAATI